jgi:hypothetical protein
VRPRTAPLDGPPGHEIGREHRRDGGGTAATAIRRRLMTVTGQRVNQRAGVSPSSARKAAPNALGVA